MGIETAKADFSKGDESDVLTMKADVKGNIAKAEMCTAAWRCWLSRASPCRRPPGGRPSSSSRRCSSARRSGTCCRRSSEQTTRPRTMPCHECARQRCWPLSSPHVVATRGRRLLAATSEPPPHRPPRYSTLVKRGVECAPVRPPLFCLSTFQRHKKKRDSV